MYAQLLDRRQQRLHLILLAPATFCCLDNSDDEFVMAADVYRDVDMNDYSVEGQCPTEVKVIYQDKSDIWLNVRKEEGRNDGHILSSISKRLCKVKKVFKKSQKNPPTHPHSYTNFLWNPIADMERTLKMLMTINV